jgi:hypothetical protein
MPATTTERGRSRSRWRRLGWFALIWCASLIAWLAFSYGFRGLLGL